jgi:AraC-like DNA-binding protein
VTSRPPLHPALHGLVRDLWVSTSAFAGPERALPTGSVHLVVRLAGPPVEIDGVTRGTAVVGGPRAAPYVRVAHVGAVSVGVRFAPGAAPMFLGVSGRSLAGAHVPLDALPALHGLADRLHDAGDRALQALEDALVGLLGDQRPDPRVVHALGALPSRGEEQVAAEVGLGVRRLRDLFVDAVGLTPRDHRRVVRLQRVLADVARDPRRPWADRAFAFGFCDQAHLSREFTALTGDSPTRYAPRPGQPNHVPLPKDPSRAARSG